MRRRKQTPINFWKCGHFSPVVIEEAKGGKIVEEWDNYDALGMMQGIGAIPEQEQPPS
jgi:hypothetical protein